MNSYTIKKCKNMTQIAFIGLEIYGVRFKPIELLYIDTKIKKVSSMKKRTIRIIKNVINKYMSIRVKLIRNKRLLKKYTAVKNYNNRIDCAKIADDTAIKIKKYINLSEELLENYNKSLKIKIGKKKSKNEFNSLFF